MLLQTLCHQSFLTLPCACWQMLKDPLWQSLSPTFCVCQLGARNERTATGRKIQLPLQARSEVCSRPKRNKWRGPCAVKGRPDPVGGRDLPGKSCSTRKQSEREGLATVNHEASDAKGPARPDQRALRP